MANSVVDYLIKISTQGLESVQRATRSTEELEESANNASSAFSKIGKAALAAFSAYKVMDYVGKATEAYRVQMVAETKLQQVMRNTMGATDEQIQSIKDLTAAQQELGVIGDEVQLGGAQELATYLSKTESLKELIPVMNDVVAQQYGLNASQEQAVGIATMMGKVMDGQTGALSRYGYTFTEAQEQILKFGTEEQRAATLAEVVTSSVGGINAALAQTDAGRMQQLSNTIGDLNEKVGQAWMWFASNVILGAIDAMGAAIDWISSTYNKFIQGVRDGNPWLLGLIGLMIGIATYTLYAKAAVIGHAIAVGAMKAVTMAVTIATKIWTAAQWLLNGALMANPIGLIIAAIVALIALISYVVYKTDGWGKTWENVIKFMKLSFEGFKAALSLRWLQIQDFFMSGIELIEKGWYKLQSLWNKKAAAEGLANLTQQRNERARELAAAQGKVKDIAGELISMKVLELSWNKERKLSDLVTSTKEKLGIATPSVPGASGVGGAVPGSVQKGAESVATGGTRSTNINISIGKMLETVNIHAQEFQDGMKDLEDKVVEAVTRALVTAQSLTR